MTALFSSRNGSAVSSLQSQLRAVFQPIIRLSDGSVCGHEGLIRPLSEPLGPLEFFALCRTQGLYCEAEIAAARCVIAAFRQLGYVGRKFVNLSAPVLCAESIRPSDVLGEVIAQGHDPSQYVIEVTERDLVDDVARLRDRLGSYRAAGVLVALDDFGNGHSNFELWHELAPDYVKLDRYLVHGMSQSPGKLSIVKALIGIASDLGTELIAEGLELPEDLALAAELGIPFVQGFLLGAPQPLPVRETRTTLPAREAMPIRVRPMARNASLSAHLRVEHLKVDAPTLTPDANNLQVAELFAEQPHLHALAVLDSGTPVGLINRRIFIEQFARQFYRDLYGRKSCVRFMHPSPLMFDARQPVESLIDVLRGEDQRYLADGFIIMNGTRYVGLGTGESLVRRVTELRIEAARYANPLTLLPGNIPITEHIDRLLDAGHSFVSAYFDLNHFKPFNDEFGYFKGDDMIRLVADSLMVAAEPQVDFVGHVGGDDFVMVFQSPDWKRRCETVLERFSVEVCRLFSIEHVRAGCYDAEDRTGNRVSIPLTSLAVGICVVPAGCVMEAEQIASLAAAAKRRAKQSRSGLWVTELTPEQPQANERTLF